MRAIFDDLVVAGRRSAPPSETRPAAALIRRLERPLMADVFRWTGHFPEKTRSLMRHLAQRADALQQVYPASAETEAIVGVTILVTSLAMNHVHRGSYFPEAADRQRNLSRPIDAVPVRRLRRCLSSPNPSYSGFSVVLASPPAAAFFFRFFLMLQDLLPAIERELCNPADQLVVFNALRGRGRGELAVLFEVAVRVDFDDVDLAALGRAAGRCGRNRARGAPGRRRARFFAAWPSAPSRYRPAPPSCHEIARSFSSNFASLSMIRRLPSGRPEKSISIGGKAIGS